MLFLLLAVSIDSIIAPYGMGEIPFEWEEYRVRFPSPERIPCILPFFPDLYRNPMDVENLTVEAGNAVDFYLRDSVYRKNKSLFKLLYFLGVDRMVEGFRDYSPNLDTTDLSLEQVIEEIREGELPQLNRRSFGGRYSEDGERGEKLSEIPEKLENVLANLIWSQYDALRWNRTALRNVRYSTREEVFLTKGMDAQSDGNLYFPWMDDARKNLDWHSLFYASLKSAGAAEVACAAISELDDKYLEIKEDIILHTPAGKIMILSGESGTYSMEDVFVAVDLGGDDEYSGETGANGPHNLISVFIDAGGDDRYIAGDTLKNSQGTGVLGTGILIDGAGDDEYIGGKISQGAGILGVGILHDVSGDDSYRAVTQTQGFGAMGIGLLIDREGRDRYYAFGNCQGDGEAGGIGCLSDWKGDDSYKAEPLSEVYDRGDYHSDYKINANNSQGFGGGRRGDGSDGHSWGGGLGMLLDIYGNDSYEAGNFSQGTGYWFGIGVLYDRKGDDRYRSCYFTQGSGAHFCFGVLIDDGGNDFHELYETGGASLGFGWDWTFALFKDCAGNDVYNEKMISMGVAEIRSIALFLELGGDDEYTVSNGGLRLGASDIRDSYREPHHLSPYHYYGDNIGLFLDISGEDSYYELSDGERVKSERFRNNSQWFHPEKDSEDWGYRNLGIGIDK